MFTSFVHSFFDNLGDILRCAGYLRHKLEHLGRVISVHLHISLPLRWLARCNPHMRATVYHGPREMRVAQVPDPILQAPTDVIARVTHAAICGSDLWSYRGIDHRAPGERMGHEWMGVVEEVGAEVRTLKKRDRVISPFLISDGTCEFCRAGLPSSCVHGARWGTLEAMNMAIHMTRPGRAVRFVGFTHVSQPPDLAYRLFQNITISGGVAPARAYLPALLQDVIAGKLEPSPVLDITVNLDGVPDGYAAIDERSAIKAMVLL